MKKTLLTGITGQDGSYLAELLLSKGYEVHGIIRKASTFNTSRIEHIYQDPHNGDLRLLLHYGDLSDMGQISNIIYNVKPDEVYNLGAMTHVRASFDIPEYTGNITGVGVTRVLDAIHKSGNDIRFYQASSSEMFGNEAPPQGIDTRLAPTSPYAAAKVYAYWMTRIYREAYNMFACNGILFNHESPRRGVTFVTRKITYSLANILKGTQKYLYLGNIESKRDWGYTPDYIEAMWQILQLDKPGDYVIGTGENHSVKEFLEEAFSYVGEDYNDYVKIDPRYYRPIDVIDLISDIEHTHKEINWKPKIRFNELVKIMVDADLRRVGLDPPGEGDKILSKKYPDKWWKRD